MSTLLDCGHLPVEDLARLAQREGRRPRPIYQAHRWFARRFGSAFRGLLTAAAVPEGGDFWAAYYAGANWAGRSILDPFVGGGTSSVEALRLGANVVGVDIDAVACAITRFETRAGDVPDLLDTLNLLKQTVGSALAPFYQTVSSDGVPSEVLHYFWVQVVACKACGRTSEAHPHYQLAYEAEGTRQWAFCPQCHEVQELPRDQTRFACPTCGLATAISAGLVQKGTFTCASCGTAERLIEVASRTKRHPEWQLFALEILEPTAKHRVPMRQRHFQPATEYDRITFAAARRALAARTDDQGETRWVPDRCIPRDGRSDNRLLRYGYARYRDLFNDRQLLHLSLLGEAIAGLAGPAREAFALAFSDHLTTNCMMTNYAFGWRRLAPLFSVRAFRHVPRPVEINPWIDGTGRGTFPNAVRQVQRAVAWARAPKEADLAGGFKPCGRPLTAAPETGQTVEIIHGDAQTLDTLQDRTFDLVLTDPPYFDNIAYSELSDFFLPWLQQFGLVDQTARGEVGLAHNLAAKSRDGTAITLFTRRLARCFRAIAKRLAPEGRAVFTYQHHTAAAWQALAEALHGSELRPIQLLPLLGDSTAGLHKHVGSIRWDAVFVLERMPVQHPGGALMLSERTAEAATAHFKKWVGRLNTSPTEQLAQADQANFYRACLVAASLGQFGSPDDGSPRLVLADELDRKLPTVYAVSVKAARKGRRNAPPH